MVRNVEIYLPIEKGMKKSLFRKFPFLSRKWFGSNLCGFANSLLSYKTEESNGNTVVP